MGLEVREFREETKQCLDDFKALKLEKVIKKEGVFQEGKCQLLQYPVLRNLKNKETEPGPGPGPGPGTGMGTGTGKEKQLPKEEQSLSMKPLVLQPSLEYAES